MYLKSGFYPTVRSFSTEKSSAPQLDNIWLLISLLHEKFGLVRQYHPKAKQLLELGCGTGTMLSHLSGKYSCTGIDNSREMLKIAKRKAPYAEVFEGDITDFELDTTFDAVICPFDTINHLTTFNDW